MSLEWRNDAGDQRCHPERIAHPRTTAELQEIVRDAELAPGDVVLEVGAGEGVLSERLAAAAAHLHTVEIDRGLEPALERVATLAGAVADSFEKAAELLEEMAGVRLSESTVERTTEDAGQRLAELVAADVPLGPRVDWPWHKDYEGKTCAYIELDATGVRQQGAGGVAAELARAKTEAAQTGKPARCFRDFRYQTLDSWTCARRVVGKAEQLADGGGETSANPRFVVTSLAAETWPAPALYERLYCARGEMENRIKECQLDLFADRTSAATMRANQLRLWFASLAYVLLCALRRIGLAHTEFATATCGSIRLKLLKIGALVTTSVRRIKLAMASGCPWQHEFALAHARLRNAAA